MHPVGRESASWGGGLHPGGRGPASGGGGVDPPAGIRKASSRHV